MGPLEIVSYIPYDRNSRLLLTEAVAKDSYVTLKAGDIAKTPHCLMEISDDASFRGGGRLTARVSIRVAIILLQT